MSEYIVAIKQWCEEMLKFYDESMELFRKNSHDLNEWKVQLIEFNEELSKEIALKDSDVYERAKELDTQLHSYLENVHYEPVERQELNQNTVPIGGHTLPPLPYSYNALEPYIDQETMRLHHDIHHKSYVDGLNKAEKEMQKARSSNNFDLIKHWEKEAAFHGAGHYLHTIFWNIMSPNGGGQPEIY